MNFPNFTHIRTAVITIAMLLWLPALAQANWLGGITFSQPSATHMPHERSVVVTIDYEISDPNGARIYVGPFTNGAATPGAVTSGSSLIPQGTGTLTRTFRIASGERTVDQVRVKMNSADNTTTMLEIFTRATYYYADAGIFNIQYSNTPYSCLKNGDNLLIAFDYANNDYGSVRISARPMTDGQLSSGYQASSTPLLSADGSTSQLFTFANVDADVDAVRFRMTADNGAGVVLEYTVPVHFLWREVGVTNITPDIPSPASMLINEKIFVSYDYHHERTDGMRVYIAPEHDGGSAGTYQGTSGPTLSYSGSDTRFFFQPSNSWDINQLRVSVTSGDNSEILFEYRIPADYIYERHAIANVQLSTDGPAILANGEYLHVNFDYQTMNSGDVKISIRPFYRGNIVSGYTTTGTGTYATGAGSAGGYFGFSSLQREIDQVRIQMKAASNSELLYEYFVDVNHFWGSTGQVSAVPGNNLPGMVMLGQNYPNPFNPITTIPLSVGQTGRVQLGIYDIRGRLVEVAADRVMAAGEHQVTFDGSRLPSGTYFYRVDGGRAGTTSGRMMLVK